MKIYKCGMSALYIALIFFISLPLYSMPLTETVYIIPENEIELKLSEELLQSGYSKEHMSIGFSVLTDLTLWIAFDYIHDTMLKTGNNDIGDTFFKIKYYIGDYYADRLHVAFILDFRLPTGKNVYYHDKWQNLALGNNELKLGPLFQFDILHSVFLHFNVAYVFREGTNENFYGGFHLNILKKESWNKAFGFNPRADNTFMGNDRLVNDYLVSVLAINSNVLYPFVPFAELYASKRIYRKRSFTRDLRIEAAGIDPTLLASLGTRYFLNKTTYSGAYIIYTLYGGEGFYKTIYGIEAAVQF